MKMCRSSLTKISALLAFLLVGAVNLQAAKLVVEGTDGVAGSTTSDLEVKLIIEDADTVSSVNACFWSLAFDQTAVSLDSVVYNDQFFQAGWANGGGKDEDGSDGKVAADWTNFTGATAVTTGEFLLATYSFSSATAQTVSVSFDDTAQNHVIDAQTYSPIIANATSNGNGYGTTPVGTFENGEASFINLYTAVNDPETPGDFDANEDEVSTIPLSSLIANDINVDTDGNEVTRDITVDSVQDASTGISSVVIDGSNVVVTPVPDFFGPVTFTYTASVDASDSGAGTVSSTATVSLTFRSVNDAPVLTQPDDVEVLEDAAPEVITLIATDVETAPENLIFTAVSNDESLVTTSVVDDQLTLTFVADAFGETTVDVTVEDEGGLTDSKSFTVTVTPVNDVPSFTKGDNEVIAENSDTPQVITGWATDISAGPANESDQTVNFVVVSTNPTMFTEEPAVSPEGTLTYTINPDTVEVTDRVSTVTVRIKDDGGILNGGVDTSDPQIFTITATFENDAPIVDAGKISVSPPVIEDSSDATTDTVVTVATGAFIDEEDGDISASATYQWQISIDGGAWGDISGATTTTLGGATRASAATGFTIYYSVRCLVSVTDQAHGLTPNTVVYGDDLNEMNTTVQIGNEPPKVVNTIPGNEIAVVVNEKETATFSASFSDEANFATTGDNGISKIRWTVWGRAGSTGDFSELVDFTWEDTTIASASGVSGLSEFSQTPDQNAQLHNGTLEYQVRAVGYDGLNVPSAPFIWNVTVKDVNTQPVLGETTVSVAVASFIRPLTEAVTTSTLVATVVPMATDEDEEDADSLVYIVNWYDSENMDDPISTDKFGGVTPTRVATYESFLVPTKTLKNRTYVAVVTVTDNSGADNAVAEGSVSDSIGVVNTAPTVGTADAGQIGSTGEETDITFTATQLKTANTLSDDDNDEIIISDPVVGTGLGTVSMANGGIAYKPGTDYKYLGATETATVIVNYAVSDDEETSAVRPAFAIEITGENDAPVVESIAIEAQDAGGNKVSTSDPLLIAQVAANILATDVDQTDTDLTATAVWTLTRKDGTSANYTDASIAVTNGVGFSSVVTLSNLGITEFAKDDKLTVVVTVNDGTVDSATLSKNFTIGNPSWFPTVDVMELAPTDGRAVMAVTVAVTFADATTSEDIVTVYAGISENDTEIRPVDYLAADWGTPVKGFKSGTTIAVSSLKIYENGTYQNVEYNTNWTLTVDQYDAASITLAPVREADSFGIAGIEIPLTSAAGYKYEILKDGGVFDNDIVLASADEDGAVTTDYETILAFKIDQPGLYTVRVWAVNPDGESAVFEISDQITQEAIDNVTPPTAPAVPDAQFLTPGSADSLAPQNLGTLSSAGGKMDVTFSWGVDRFAAYYGLCIMKADGSVVFNEIVDSVLSATVALPAGKFQWCVISWNQNGFSGETATPVREATASWSEVRWIQIDSPDQEANTTPELADINIESVSYANGTLTITLVGGVALPEGCSVDTYFNNTVFRKGAGLVSTGYSAEVMTDLYIRVRKGDSVSSWSANLVIVD